MTKHEATLIREQRKYLLGQLRALHFYSSKQKKVKPPPHVRRAMKIVEAYNTVRLKEDRKQSDAFRAQRAHLERSVLFGDPREFVDSVMKFVATYKDELA
jgi:hypothetical protein